MQKNGVFNTNADELSRINKVTTEGEPEEKWERVTGEEMKATILYEYHDSQLGGAPGHQ